MPYADDSLAAMQKSVAQALAAQNVLPGWIHQIDFGRIEAASVAGMALSRLVQDSVSPLQSRLRELGELNKAYAFPNGLAAIADSMRIGEKFVQFQLANVGMVAASALRSPALDLAKQFEWLRSSNLEFEQSALPLDLFRARTRSVRGWRIVVDGLPTTPSAQLLTRASLAGVSTLATARTVSILSADDPDDELLDDEVELPSIRDGLRVTFLRQLDALGNGLLRRWEGAWSVVLGGGPDAASQACHSLQELIDATLHALAPDAEALSWHSSTNRPAGEIDRGRPTRALRAHYALRERATESSAISFYLRSLKELSTVLQNGKHSRDVPHTLAAVRTFIASTEALLAFLLAE